MELLGIAFLGACIAFWSNQKDYIFEPTTTLQTTPERVGLKADTILIPSGKGSEQGELYSWWIPAENVQAPTMLYFHGNDKNIGHARDLEFARRLHELGCNVLMIDYRGYGKSTGGKPTESKVYEDAESAWDYLVNQRGIAAAHIFIYGHSLGGAIAIELATRHPDAAGIIEESSFTSMPAVVTTLSHNFPTGVLIDEKFDSLSRVAQLKIPLLIIHGTWDHLVPYKMGQQLYDAAHQPKTIGLIEGGAHESSCIAGQVECKRILSTFVSENMH